MIILKPQQSTNLRQLIPCAIHGRGIMESRCNTCKHIKLLWSDTHCKNCTDNQLFLGDLKHYRKDYGDLTKTR